MNDIIMYSEPMKPAKPNFSIRSQICGTLYANLPDFWFVSKIFAHYVYRIGAPPDNVISVKVRNRHDSRNFQVIIFVIFNFCQARSYNKISNLKLSDATINGYLSMVFTCDRIHLPQGVFIFNANFTNYLENIGNNASFTLNFLNQNGIGGSNFLECPILYFPVHVSPDFDHWVLIRMDREKKVITQFDSLNGDFHLEIYTKFLKFLNVKIPGDQFRALEYVFETGHSARQTDSSSCGIYTILNCLDQLKLIDFEIESNSRFIQMIKTIMVHEFLAFENDPDCFVLDILGSSGSQ